MLSFRYEVFYSVASNLSFSKAANDLYISQPAVSKQVKQLEAELGVALFERKGNTIKLTPSGQQLFDHLKKAKKIQRQVQSEFELKKGEQEQRGELKIGASTTISLYVMPKILSTFHKQYPKVKVLLMNRNSENVLNALINQEIDLACIESYHKINAVHYHPFMKDRIVAVCAAKSSLGATPISLEELKKVPLAIRERGSGTLEVLVESLLAKGIKLNELNVIARLGGTEALKNYLKEGQAVGFLSRLSAKRELEANELVVVDVSSFKVEREFNFVMRQGEESMGMIRFIMKKAQEVYNQ